MKYRLVKVTKANGFVLWVVQQKHLFWWVLVDAYFQEDEARFTLKQLKSGLPKEKREIIV